MFKGLHIRKEFHDPFDPVIRCVTRPVGMKCTFKFMLMDVTMVRRKRDVIICK